MELAVNFKIKFVASSPAETAKKLRQAAETNSEVLLHIVATLQAQAEKLEGEISYIPDAEELAAQESS